MKIVATSPSFSKNPVLQQEICDAFSEVVLNTEGIRYSGASLSAFLKDAEGAVIGLEKIDEELLSHCPNLKIVSKYGVGLNNIDLDACQRKGVKIGWTGGVNRLSVAEMALGYMLMLCRNLYVTSNQLKAGTWNKSGGFQLSGKTVGIIGVGHIGKELVRLLAPFKCRILVNDIIEQDDYYNRHGLIFADKERIFKEADIISLHTPLDDSTENLMSIEAFEMMKESAYIINSARGGIIDENALKTALVEKKIAGAAIDVYLEEPPVDMELMTMENLICTPHIGGNAKEAIEAMGRSAIHHLRTFFNR